MKFATELFSVIRDSLHTVTAVLELQTEELVRVLLLHLEPDIRGIQ